MFCSDIFCFDFSKCNCSSVNNQLGSRAIVGFKQLIYFNSDFLFDEWIVLSKEQVILHELNDQEYSCCDFIDFPSDYDVVTNDPEIAN